MQKIGIQEILSNVEKPSRYLGTEVNRVRKSADAAALRMVLAFPDLYEIGTSHFGIQILYHLMNQRNDCAVERVFCPAGDYEAQLRSRRQPLCSLESQTPLKAFHIIGFSLLYELNYTNVLNMLDLAGIALHADQRTDDDPFVIAGGPCVSNPEPMAAFFDAMVFGDGEQVMPRMADQWIRWRQNDGGDRKKLLARWAGLEGVYIPAFFKAHIDEQGFQRLQPVFEGQERIRRTVVADLDKASFPDSPVVPFGKPVHDRLRLEISRGCSRGCRFCQAGMIYRPVRERSPETLLRLCEQALANTGYEDISLLSLSTGDYTCLAPLMETLMQRAREQRVAVSLPSIRAGTLTPTLMKLIRQVRKTGFTIAPEAGSQRLRDVINKNVCEEEIVATVRDAFSLGWKVIKLYFMIGLPTETEQDLEQIVALVQRLRQIKGPGQRFGKINVSVTTFIPKAHTPFQWAPQIELRQSWDKITYLKDRLKVPGVHFKWQNPNMSLLEGLVARGDRRVAKVIETAWRLGCRFDGWSDHLDYEKWEQAFEQSGVPVAFFTTRERTLEEPLPWDHMDAGIDGSFLKRQWHDAQCCEKVSDCRFGKCHNCGICDFKTVQPVVFNSYAGNQDEQGSTDSVQINSDEQEAQRVLELIYTKKGQARFFAHLEVAGMFARALRRARIGIRYSKGYHPMPRMSFDDPIPLGMESEGERMRLRVTPQQGCNSVLEGLNKYLPEGLSVVSCREIYGAKKFKKADSEKYHILISCELLDWNQWREFTNRQTWPYTRKRPNGKTHDIDLKLCGLGAGYEKQGQCLVLTISGNQDVLVRPADVLRSIFNVSEERLNALRIIKQAKDQQIAP